VNSLEQQTFSDGFRIVLVCIFADPAIGQFQFRTTSFDGGRIVAENQGEEVLFSPSASFLSSVRETLLRVLAPPHVLVVSGRGWKELLWQWLPSQVLSEMRILDLHTTALALAEGLPARAGTDEILREYRIAARVDVETNTSAVHQDILWAVLARAGRAGMSWPQLLHAAESERPGVSFEQYEFTADQIASLPQAPGVYILHDARGAALYVGKAGNVCQRLSSYFRPLRHLPAKIRSIRDRTKDLDYELVGSELEALLLENRLIRELRPVLNVQRRVAEGTSRCAYPVSAVVLVGASVSPNRVELFFFGGERKRAVQLRVSPYRPPGRLLGEWVDYFSGRRKALRGSPRLTDWAADGNEICCRHFARFSDQLQWADVDETRGSHAFIDALLRIVKTVAQKRPEPGEFRLSSD
jgi:hypothetical protein